MWPVLGTIGLLIVAGLIIAPQTASVFGRARGIWAGGVFAGILAVSWSFLDRSAPRAAPSDWAAVPSVSSETCIKCHADHHESWRQTYHRTMTREATAEYVKGDFDDAVHDYQGLPTRFSRAGGAFRMETVDPEWALLRAKAGDDVDALPTPRFSSYKVDRLVGSHWLQECLHKLPNGRYIRLPVLYHIGEKRWIHSNGAFLSPDTDDFWQKCRSASWNETCLYCHNTGPRKNPIRGGGPTPVGYKSEVTELGISCEACHGPGGEHVRRNQNPAHRFDIQLTGAGDPSIVNPRRLPVQRRDEVCARCHGALVPKAEMWDRTSVRDPFVPGMELTRVNHFFSSEEEQARLTRGLGKEVPPPPPGPTDGRFWGDGTPLTTALEYTGFAMSACYQKGKGSLSCLSCHEMHGNEPNHMLKPEMRTNEACYQCHQPYRDKLVEHTRHPASSPGSLCYNCHMPHVVYSLMATHRSHRIENPTLAASVGTGKPHACNLCHLDKSLGWTRDQLAKWPSAKSRPTPNLSEDEERVASSILLFSQGDARTRVVVAGAFANPAAHQAAGTNWYGPLLVRLLEDERYPAVRYLAHRGLQAVHGEAAAGPFDFQARRPERQLQLRALREKYDGAAIPLTYPYLPLDPDGRPDDSVLRRLLQRRTDPDLTINE
jgi:predicted CXXCH cytochrome family protein